jgi:hypothetical protein
MAGPLALRVWLRACFMKGVETADQHFQLIAFAT